MVSVWFFVEFVLFFFKQKTAYEMRISDWSSDVCSLDLLGQRARGDDADDAARDQRLRSAALLRLGRRFGLVGDRDAVPGLDQPREIAFRRVRGHAAHRDYLAFMRSAEHASELQSLMRISYAVFCMNNNRRKKKNT